MKDLTTTTFGLIIAYLLPGLFGLYTCSFWSPAISAQFEAFSKAESNAGLFFLVVLFALFVGLQLTAFRWVIFELILCRRNGLKSDEFTHLKTKDQIEAYGVVLDENFRYHQFWGGIAPVVPVFFLGLGRKYGVSLWSFGALPWFVVFLVVEAVTVAAAIEAHTRYVARARASMKEGSHAERKEEKG